MEPKDLVRRLADQRPAAKRAARVRSTLGPAFGPDATTYAGMLPSTTIFSWLPQTSAVPHLNLVVPSADPATAYAGVKTALGFVATLAEQLGMPFRVITLDTGGAPADVLDASFGFGPAEVIRLGDGIDGAVGERDRWVVTHWTTAHAADIASRVGYLDPASVVYLVQDYEPGFVPWSSDYAAIRSTYHAGFRIVVNSTPLRDHLVREEGIGIDDDFVIAPDLDLARLERLRATRAATPRDATAHLLFYARPTKPRNLFAIGAAAIRRAAHELGDDARRCTLHTAGEPHAPIGEGRFLREVNHGAMAWEAYFELLPTIDVGLSLMYSPHPSHPPLDMALSGSRVVTNRFGVSRDALHPGVEAVAADPDVLAAALVARVRAALDGAADPVPGADVLRVMGRPVAGVVEAVASAMRPTEGRPAR